MGVVIYPRLGEVLEAKSVTVPELRRRIKERFGLSVSTQALYGLALDEPVGRVDLTVIGAAAAALDVTLNDLLTVETSPNGIDTETGVRVLGPRESRRLAELFDRQGRTRLSESEAAELKGLVDLYGRLLHERQMRELAEKRGVPVEQARREADAALAAAQAWWRAFESDPANRQAVIDDRSGYTDSTGGQDHHAQARDAVKVGIPCDHDEVPLQSRRGDEGVDIPDKSRPMGCAHASANIRISLHGRIG